MALSARAPFLDVENRLRGAFQSHGTWTNNITRRTRSYLHGFRKEIRQYVVEDVQLTFGLRVVDIRPYVEEKVEVVICSMGTRGELASWKQREDKRRKATRSTHIKVESQVCLEGG